MRKTEVRILFPKEVVEYLKAKFNTKEEAEAFVVSLVRKEMRIDFKKPKLETLKYRLVRQKVIELRDDGKEISAETLAQKMDKVFNVSMARDWLARMVEDGFIVLDSKGIGGKKIYRWIGEIEQ